MKVVLIGSNGQLGTDFAALFERRGIELHSIAHRSVDICDEAAISELIASARPDFVVNTAAFHQLDRCEADPHTAFAVNATGARNLARACDRHGAVLVHFSTDYVFDGQKGTAYSETDLPTPLNVYGISKVAGEQLVACTLERKFIVRTCGLFGLAGPSGKGLNFVENMLKRAAGTDPIRVVDDQILSPTYTADLAEHVLELMGTEAFGLYHLSAEGESSWYDFAKEIFRQSGVHPDLSPGKTVEPPGTTRRPRKTTMSKSKFNELGLGKMKHWSEGLQSYLQKRH